MFSGMNPSRMYWPYFRYELELTRTEEDLRAIANSLGLLYTLMLWITLISGHFIITYACNGGCLACGAARRRLRGCIVKRNARTNQTIVGPTCSENKQARYCDCRLASSVQVESNSAGMRAAGCSTMLAPANDCCTPFCVQACFACFGRVKRSVVFRPVE